MYLEKILAADAQSRMTPAELALAVVQVTPYTRGSAKGDVVRVHSYSRMARDAMQAHLAAHGMSAGDFGHDFHHPQSLAAWHGMDHLARGATLDHGHHAADDAGGAVRAQHPAEHAEHAAGGHPGGGGHGGHLPGFLGHMAAWEGPAIAHREIRRTIDRQTRRRAYRLRSRQSFDSRHSARPPGAPGATPSGGSFGSQSSSGGGGGGSSGGGSGSSGGGSGGGG